MKPGRGYKRCDNCFCSDKKALCNNVGDDPIKVPSYITNLYINCSTITNLNISSLPTNVKLSYIHIKNSHVYQISPNTFKHQTSIEHFEATANTFQNISQLYQAMAPLSNLEELKLRELNILNITEAQFTDFVDVSKIITLSFKGNRLSVFDTQFFSKFTRLRYLDLRQNDIHRFVGSTPLPSLKDLNLQANKLYTEGLNLCRQNESSLFTSLETLNLGGNSFSVFPAPKLKCLQSLKDLRFAENILREFDLGELSTFLKLKKLSFRDNWLTNITLGPFPPALEELDISDNDFNIFPPQLCRRSSTGQFPNMTTIYISRCAIRQLYFDDWYRCLPNLRTLDFSKNLIIGYSNISLAGLYHLESLNLDENRLTDIGEELFSMMSLKRLSIRFNWIHFHKPQNWNMFLRCTNVTHLNVSYNTLGYLLSENLTYIFSPLKRLEELRIKGCKFDSIPTAMLNDHPTLKLLDIDKNSLKVIQFPVNFSAKIEIISAADNKIPSIKEVSFPPDMLKHLKRLNLKWNPFNCECHNGMRWFRQNINGSGYFETTKLIGWPYGYLCWTSQKQEFLGHLFKEFYMSDGDCSLSKSLVEFTALGCSMFVILVLAAVWYWNRWYVNYYWLLFKKNLCGRSNETERRHRYSGFVINHKNNEDFVSGDFKVRMEDKLGYRLHWWGRDSDVGPPKVDVILDAMDASKAVFVIVSNDLLTWSWGIFQVDVAIARRIDNEENKIFFVLLEDINRNYLSKSWCVMLTKMPGVTWCRNKDNIWVKLFDQEVKELLGPPAHTASRNDSIHDSIDTSDALQNDSINIEWENASAQREREPLTGRTRSRISRFSKRKVSSDITYGSFDSYQRRAVNTNEDEGVLSRSIPVHETGRNESKETFDESVNDETGYTLRNGDVNRDLMGQFESDDDARTGTHLMTDEVPRTQRDAVYARHIPSEY